MSFLISFKVWRLKIEFAITFNVTQSICHGAAVMLTAFAAAFRFCSANIEFISFGCSFC